MTPAEFFKGLLLRTPQEIAIALLRLLLLLLLAILILLLKFWNWLLWLFRTGTFKDEESEEPCGKIPEAVVRRPDPCIYSQTYLASQGLPVTWDNPDIWMAPAATPGSIEPDSYHLTADTDYLVSVQAHNASTDPAIGVGVRLVYRPWSFNSPDLVPVEVDAGGHEVTRSVDIPAMGAAVATFIWHTPALAAGEEAHYCLQAHLSHPLDVNPANNMGQENTQVYSESPAFVTPGQLTHFDVPLFNVGRTQQRITFHTDRYLVAPDEVELQLERRTAKARYSLADRLGHGLPTVEPVERGADRPVPKGTTTRASASASRHGRDLVGAVSFSSPKSRFQLSRTRYRGLDALRSRILERDYAIPVEMVVDAPAVVELDTEAFAVAPFEVRVPLSAQPGDRFPLNIRAENDDGGLVGGVTLFFHVEP